MEGRPGRVRGSGPNLVPHGNYILDVQPRLRGAFVYIEKEASLTREEDKPKTGAATPGLGLTEPLMIFLSRPGST